MDLFVYQFFINIEGCTIQLRETTPILSLVTYVTIVFPDKSFCYSLSLRSGAKEKRIERRMESNCITKMLRKVLVFVGESIHQSFKMERKGV